MKTLAPIADADLALVSGGKKHGHGPSFSYSPVAIAQTNVGGPIVQIAIGNSGDVTQNAGFSQSNSVSF